jgi:hypothetical protein
MLFAFNRGASGRGASSTVLKKKWAVTARRSGWMGGLNRGQ